MLLRASFQILLSLPILPTLNRPIRKVQVRYIRFKLGIVALFDGDLTFFLRLLEGVFGAFGEPPWPLLN